ncbi:MAG: hypothetical protein AB7F59_03565 [Bdellovibrionales bacterium]
MKKLSLGFLTVLMVAGMACNKSGDGGGGGGGASPAATTPPPEQKTAIVSYDNRGKPKGYKIRNQHFSIYNSDRVPVEALELPDGKSLPVQNATFFSHLWYLQCVGGKWKNYGVSFLSNQCYVDFFRGDDSCVLRTHLNWVATTEFDFDSEGYLSFRATINNVEYRAFNIGYLYNGRYLEIKKFMAQSSNSNGAPYIKLSTLSSLNSRYVNSNMKTQLVDTTKLIERIGSVRDMGAGFRFLQPIVVEFGSNARTPEEMQQRIQDPRYRPGPFQNPGNYNPSLGMTGQPMPNVDMNWMKRSGLDNELDVHNAAIIGGQVLLYKRDYLGQRPNRKRYPENRLSRPYEKEEYSIRMDDYESPMGFDEDLRSNNQRTDGDDYFERTRRELNEKRPRQD